MLPKPKHEIPLHWKADFALAFVGFLEGIIQAVWDRHGPDMYQLIKKHADEIGTPRSDAEKFFDDDLYPEIPF